MSVHDNEVAKGQDKAAPSSTQQSYSQRQTAAPAPQAAAPVKETGVLNMRSLDRISRSPLSRNANSEIMVKLQEAMAKIYDGIKDQYEIRLMALDNNSYRQLRFSTLVVCVRERSKPNVGVAYHSLVLEATGQAIPPLLENIAGRQVEVIRPPDAAWDPDLINVIETAIREAYVNVPILPADGCVIGRNFDVTKEVGLYPLARNAIIAASTVIDQFTPGFEDLNLAKGQFSNLAVMISTEQFQILNDADEPMRSDMRVELVENYKQANGTNQSPNNGDKNGSLGYLTGFVDVGWAPLAPQQVGFGAYVPQQGIPGAPVPTQKFAARFVVTHLENNELSTLPAILLNVAMATTIAENMNWVNVFRNTGGSRRTHDFGALNYEGNLMNSPSGVGELIPTNTDDFRVENLFQMAQMLIQPGIAIAIDVPDCGPQTWYLAPLAAAANGNPGAIAMVIDSWNDLTNGMFGKEFSEPLFINPTERIHLGYYTDANGARADIRDLDYLSVATARGAHDIELVRKWSDTFVAMDIPLPMRLETRARIIKELFPSAVFTGMATRVTFAPKPLLHGVQCIMNNGVRPVIQTSGFGLGMGISRGVAGYAQGGLYQPGQAQFHVGGMQPQYGGQYGNMSGYNRRFQ